MRKGIIIETFDQNIKIRITPERVVIRKHRNVKKDYEILLKSIDDNIIVNKTYEGIINNNKIIVINEWNSIIMYFNPDTMLLTDYFKNGKVYFCKGE